jgi:hypothetical protein
MYLSKHDQLNLIRKIENMVGNIGDYLYEEKDAHVNRQIDCIENALDVLKQSFYDENTCIILIERETGERTHKYFEKGDVGALCHTAAKFYAFDDLDDTYRIDSIWCDGKELEYMGWQPGMLFEFREVDTGEIVYSASFECWDH